MKIAVIVTVALAAANPAFAQSGPSNKAELDRAFLAMDANKDGAVSRDEFDRHMQAKHAQQAVDLDAAFKEMDKNKDRKLSRQEAAANPVIASVFDALDADKDGHLSDVELRAALQKAQEVGSGAP